MQGHLICHFFLGSDPIAIPPEDPFDGLREFLGSPTVAEKARRRLAFRRRITRRSHWSAIADPVALRVVGEYLERGGPDLLPVRAGVVMRLEQARCRWLGILEPHRG